MTQDVPQESSRRQERRWMVAVVLAALVGTALLIGSIGANSATYDEPTYLRVASTWWQTGDQSEISRMGSPLLFWKLQQAPPLWLNGWYEWFSPPGPKTAGFYEIATSIAPQSHEGELRLYRYWSITIWLAAFGLTTLWAHRLSGPRSMTLAAWLFALSPNLLAHGALLTMELPLVAFWMLAFWLFWEFLRRGHRWVFVASAFAAGLAFSCKFTTVLAPPILALAWWLERRREGANVVRLTFRVAGGMVAYGLIVLASDWAVNGFAMLPLAHETGAHPSLDGKFGLTIGKWIANAIETPIPQDWVGFATQMQHQRGGGSSYLFGVRRMHGWWYYYFVALAVKVPLTFWLLVGGRIALRSVLPKGERTLILPLTISAFLAITALGSSRNYGVRYLLPLVPLAIVWVSSLAEGGKWARRLVLAGLIGQAVAVASVHPYELTYFNALAGGPIGGRRILADSNLDWGQGLVALASLQTDHPEYADLTLYYFGDVDPVAWNIAGTGYRIDAGREHPTLPAVLDARTTYLGVSASLQWGPWGPDGYFRELDGIEPVHYTADKTIAIYRTVDLERRRHPQ